MRAVDTNVLVRLITRDDPRHLAIAEEFARPGAWVSHLVVAETAWVLDAVYELSAEQIAMVIEMLLNHDRLALQDADVVEAALADYRARPALGFSDCLVLATARKAGHLPLGTFDKQLARLSGAEGLGPRGVPRT